MAIEVGQKAPEFGLKDQNGELVKLSDYLGKKNVVLSFHALAWTSVCAAQMLHLHFTEEEFAKRDTVVFGVSVDSVPSKAAWAKALGLGNLRILADFHPKGNVAEKYGLLRREGVSERAVVLIDKEGIVRWVKVYPMKEVPMPQDVLEAIDRL
jgi:peroxiredoxin